MSLKPRYPPVASGVPLQVGLLKISTDVSGDGACPKTQTGFAVVGENG